MFFISSTGVESNDVAIRKQELALKGQELQQDKEQFQIKEEMRSEEKMRQDNIDRERIASQMDIARMKDDSTQDRLEQQKELVAKGASQTMKSKHLTGHAVDLMAYINGRGSWELNLYDDLADAMKEGADMAGVAVKWGAAWSVGDMRKWEGTMEEAMNSYVDLRR